MTKTRKRENGNVLAYVMAAVFLAGALILTLTSGSGKSGIAIQLDELNGLFHSDILLAESAVQDCVIRYGAPADLDGDGDTDATDNPNPPFPVYDDGSTGGTGDSLKDVLCPGAPGTPAIFNNAKGRGFRIFDNAAYTVTYLNTAADGAYIRVTRAAADPAWTEVISRLDARYSGFKSADITAGGTCANGCFYYWFVRPTGSTLGGEGASP